MSVPDVVFERHQNRSLLSQGIVKNEEEEYVEEKPYDEEYVEEEKKRKEAGNHDEGQEEMKQGSERLKRLLRDTRALEIGLHWSSLLRTFRNTDATKWFIDRGFR